MNVGGPAVRRLALNCMSACKTFLIVKLLHWVRELYPIQTHCSVKTVELQGLQAALSHNAP